MSKENQNKTNTEFDSKTEVQRIDRKYIISEISSVLNFDKGILYTLRELLIRPGINIQNFIAGDRKRLVKPIVYIILCSLIYTVLQQILDFEDGYVNFSFEEENKTIHTIFSWITSHYGYANVLMSVPIALWLRLFFIKRDYNFYETLILIFYAMGTGMLIFSMGGILMKVSNSKIPDVGFLIGSCT